MKTAFFTHSLLFFCVLLLAKTLPAQSGTSDGTYNFSALGADNSGGTGFKTQGDKFKVSNIFAQDRKTMYANNSNAGETQTVVIKAEGGTKNKTFTFMDLSVRNYATSSALDIFTITLRNYFGAPIATLVLASNQSLTTTAAGIAGFAFTTPFPAEGYPNVAEIQIDFHYADGSVSPDELTFSTITIANVSNLVPLPISLVDFTARKEGSGVRVNWTTASEEKVAKHVIEHSKDGIRFTAIASFPGMQSASSGATYSFFHASPSSGKNYYRLKEVDVDGSEKSFVVRTVDISKRNIVFEGALPLQEFVTVKGLAPGTYELNLVDLSGHTVMSTKLSTVSGDAVFTVADALPRGTYLITLAGQGDAVTQKLVKQ